MSSWIQPHDFVGQLAGWNWELGSSSRTIAQIPGLSSSLQFEWLYNGHSGYSFDITLFLYCLTWALSFQSLYFLLFFFLLRFSFSVLEHLNVTTLLASSIRLFPVAGKLLIRPTLWVFWVRNKMPDMRNPVSYIPSAAGSSPCSDLHLESWILSTPSLHPFYIFLGHVFSHRPNYS